MDERFKVYDIMIIDFLRGFKYWFANRIINWLPVGAFRRFWLTFGGATLGKNSSIHLGVIVLGPHRNLSIGANSVINPECRLDARRGLFIGSNVSISREVFILTLGHDYNDPNFKLKGDPVYIEDNVWVGVRSVILPGVTLGEGCVVGANSTVTHDTEPWSVYAGSPARKVGVRNEQDFKPISYDPFFGFMT